MTLKVTARQATRTRWNVDVYDVPTGDLVATETNVPASKLRTEMDRIGQAWHEGPENADVEVAPVPADLVVRYAL